jgi:very-short-patch-repair endonuclease
MLANHLGREMTDGTEDILADLDALLADIPTLAKLPELHRLRGTLEASLLGELLESVDAQPLNRSEAADTLSFAWHASVVEHLQLSDPRLGAFEGSQHDELVSEFQEADREHIGTTPQRVRRLCAEQAVRAEDATPEDASLIRAEANKKRKHLATRQLFSAAPEMMMAIKPCWAMSPLVVSQVLPSDRPYFDVVIFDEASQIRPAEAMTAILRGKQLVVAGDEHQLPPTSFFNSTNPEIEDDSDLDQLAVDGSYESILEALAAFIDFRMLEWHYRSRDERLINFSNVHVYDRGLTTFPGIVGPDCVSHVSVPHVAGEVGGELSASAEVEKVVELILAHAREHPDQSLGVITMGMKHAERIEEARRQALEEDEEEELAEFFDESRPEPFFVKNLERVQGDERDAIILAVGYGKNADGRLLYHFGPLNMEGGERRLNVAVSRAKERMTLVSSFDHRDMDPERSTGRGVELLRSYLEYCSSNGARLGDADTTKPELNPFEVDVRNNLERAGILLDPQHGCSGYRIDFAAKHPRRPGQMVLAIECDGATYHSSQSARDRDRLRQEHLERLGWRFHRIWSQDWFANKQAEVDRAKAAFEAAMRAEDEIDAKAEAASRENEERKVAGPPGETDPTAIDDNGSRPRAACPVRTGRAGIEQYSPAELAALIKWIEADTLLRTKEQLIDAAIQQLGFRKRGSRIVSALEGAIELARNSAGSA